MKKLNFIYRFYLNKKVLVVFLIIAAVSCLLYVFGRLSTLDTLVYAFAPPIELVFFAITVLFLFALKNHNYELLTSLVSGFLVLLLVWPLYWVMIINFPPVVTQIPPGEVTEGLFIHLTCILLVIYFIVIQILCTRKRNLNKVIKFNTVLCSVFCLFVLIIMLYVFIEDLCVNIIGAASYDLMLNDLAFLFYYIPATLVYICGFNIVVSLQTMKYLINRNLLDEYL